MGCSCYVPSQFDHPITVVDSAKCEFEDKYRNAVENGAKALIVINKEWNLNSTANEYLPYLNSWEVSNQTILSVMISATDGLKIKNCFDKYEGVIKIRITNDPSHINSTYNM